jgi:hypothetical protein
MDRDEVSPDSFKGKSWSSTFLGLYSLLSFLEFPIFSFFLVSTEITGSPFFKNAAALAFIRSRVEYPALQGGESHF